MGHMTTMFADEEAAMAATIGGKAIIIREDARRRCVCSATTLMDCRQCGAPACGNCIDTPKHAERFHAA